MGKLIVIEGLDGCGKTTQINLLKEQLGDDVEYIKFPNYSEASGSLIKMYLAGEFGTASDCSNAYSASLLYTVDRFASYKKTWEKDYLSSKTVLCDRYTSSNIIHQMSKLPSDERAAYMNWLHDLEFNKVGLPRPDAVIFLDVPIEVSQRLMSERYKGDESKKDIHENNLEYLNKCYGCAKIAAKYLEWHVIKCTSENKMRPIKDINKEILEIISKI